MNKIFIHFFNRVALKLGSSILLVLFCLTVNSQNHWQGLGLSIDRQILGLFHDTIDNRLYVCGSFHYANGMYVKGIINWDGTTYSHMGFGFDYHIGTPFTRAITRYKNQIYVGGDFWTADTSNVYGIARWTGSKWDSLSSGMKDGNNNPGADVFALVVHNNELIVGGAFYYAGNVLAHSLARWDGTNWHDAFNFPCYDSTPGGTSHILCLASYQGGLYAGGWIPGSQNANVNLLYSNGQNWSPVGGGVLGNSAGVYCMEVYKNELYVGGCFTKQDGNIGNGIQKWNGQQWSEVGGGVTLSGSSFSAVKHMHVFNNELYVTGDFDKAGNIPAYCYAKWNGSQWCSLDNNLPSAFTVLSDFDNKPVCAGYLTINNDTTPQWLVTWTGGNYVDTCSTPGNSVLLEDITSPKLSVFPNPAANIATIQYTLEKPEQISITLTDILSSEKRLLVEQYQINGNHSIELNTMALKPGIYLCTLISNSFTISEKLVIIR